MSPLKLSETDSVVTNSKVGSAFHLSVEDLSAQKVQVIDSSDDVRKINSNKHLSYDPKIFERQQSKSSYTLDELSQCNEQSIKDKYNDK